MNNYFLYHLHTELSLLDSCTNYKDYVDLAKSNNMTALCFSEHGVVFNWLEKKHYCEKNGIKYIHGCEIYLTESLDNKVRDNYHTILIAKNNEGFKELNRLIGLSSDDAHFYYKPRLTFDEFLAISDNIVSTSACLASPLNRLDENHPYFKRLVDKYTYLEIQPHLNDEQISYNQKLINLANKFNKKLIAGTDTHSSTKYKSECRDILKKAKKMSYDNEDTFDLTFKTYDELVSMFEKQNIDKSVYLKAIENTNILADSIQPIVIDYSFKYPDLYPDEENMFKKEVLDSLNKKASDGILDISKVEIYKARVKEEFIGYKKTGMFSFMLFMSELLKWCRENNIPTSPARGSCGGSFIAYLLDITDLDAVEWDTIFSRFVNEHRVSLGDIDVDFAPNDRERVYEYIINRFGVDKTSYILTTNTIADKGTIDDIGRALDFPLNKVALIKKEYEQDPVNTRANYPDLFYYFDGLVGTVVSQGIHPAGIIASPITLPDNICTFTYDGKIVSSLNMDEVHDLNLVKYDILGLKNVGIIKDTCRYINQAYPRTHSINWEDINVWNDMITSPIGLFQFEGDYAFSLLKEFKPMAINDMSIVNAALRPSGASYRDNLIAKIKNTNPSEVIDDLLARNNGYLIFQEDVIAFLQHICGLSGGEADNVRRAIGQKKEEELKKALPKILEGYCSKSNKDRATSEQEAKEFLRIIEDASSYMFGYNHSTAYSMLGYLCAMYRYYYPLEFTTAFLNNSETDEDKQNGVKLAKEKGFEVISPKFGFSKGEYFFNKETGSIYIGVGGVKGLNRSIGDSLYSLSQNTTYNSFVDLLIDIKIKTKVNSGQLTTLIELDYFSDFGGVKKLKAIVEIFNTYYSKKQFTKAKLSENEEAIIKKHAGKETEKLYKDVNVGNVILDLTSNLEEIPETISEIAERQYKLLGDISVTNSALPKTVQMVVDVDTTYSPKLTLYGLKTGKITVLKCSKKYFEYLPCSQFDVLNIKETEKKQKGSYINGVWTPKENEFDFWIKSYTKIKL